MSRAVPVALTAILLTGAGVAAKKPALVALADRYDRLACAVVQVSHPGGAGTGFFISADGDVLTTASIAVNRTFSEPAPGQVRVDIDYNPGLQLVRNGVAEPLAKLPPLVAADVERAMADLVILRTGLQAPCILPLSKRPGEARIGQHVIAIGYPISSAASSLYEGFISAKYERLPVPMAIVNGRPMLPSYNVIGVQMPVTAGASGGPVITDNDEVIGVITDGPPTWFSDLNALVQKEQAQEDGFAAPTSDLQKLVAKLAWVVQEFATSGAGFAVPVSYLERLDQTASPPPTAKTSTPEAQPHHGWFGSLLDRL